jgi:uncharacterized protein YfaS (alpha-2-macroglobulin family)
MYKTIMLELLQQRPHLHEQLRKNRKLLPALEILARALKRSHQGWQSTLSQLMPGSDQSQISSEALEIALQEMEARLPTESPVNQEEALSLDQAMAFIRRHTSRG